jgi:nucleoside-diphosphate-sugar epimerase
MQARRKIAVAGATGKVGRHVVDVLEPEGHDVVAMLWPGTYRLTVLAKDAAGNAAKPKRTRFELLPRP